MRLDEVVRVRVWAWSSRNSSSSSSSSSNSNSEMKVLEPQGHHFHQQIISPSPHIHLTLPRKQTRHSGEIVIITTTTTPTTRIGPNTVSDGKSFRSLRTPPAVYLTNCVPSVLPETRELLGFQRPALVQEY
ncbi:hypothetical protein E2C01_041504 [Portunus trituberculatus]|uniref:Uncharacterized protein n=1 Tax=Portunus trituberculatus TaxID=210409 RepID=A0A5B7FS26_PORTR|nr:hypothetical protein [Portunus trituberculatus]